MTNVTAKGVRSIMIKHDKNVFACFLPLLLLFFQINFTASNQVELELINRQENMFMILDDPFYAVFAEIRVVLSGYNLSEVYMVTIELSWKNWSTNITTSFWNYTDHYYYRCNYLGGYVNESDLLKTFKWALNIQYQGLFPQEPEPDLTNRTVEKIFVRFFNGTETTASITSSNRTLPTIKDAVLSWPQIIGDVLILEGPADISVNNITIKKSSINWKMVYIEAPDNDYEVKIVADGSGGKYNLTLLSLKSQPIKKTYQDTINSTSVHTYTMTHITDKEDNTITFLLAATIIGSAFVVLILTLKAKKKIKKRIA